MPDIDHRGRVQAQGGGLEESIPWAQEHPPTGDDAHLFLNKLKELLKPSEQDYRENAFHAAHRYVDRARNNGGVDAQVKKSFPTPPRRDGRRVDIEVIKGRAFVPE